MPLIVEINHEDYATSNVAKDARAVQYFLEKEKRFSLDEFRRRTNYSYLIDLLNEYGCAKLFDLKGGCVGGIYPAEDLCDIETIKKEHERNRAFGIA